MQLRLQILVLLASIGLILLVLELIRRGRLREEYSLIWLLGGVIIFIMALFRGSLQLLAGLVQIEYGPSLIFMVGIVLLAVIQLFQTVTISRLTSHNRDLAQKLAILELRQRNLMGEVAPQMMAALSRLSQERLLALGQGLQEAIDVHGFLRHALQLSLASLGASSGSILILDENGNPIEGALAYGDEEPSYEDHKLEDTVVQGLAGWVVRNRQPALVISTRDDSRWLKRPWDDTNGSSRSAMSVPLLAGDKVLGVLTLSHPQARRFSENDLALLMAIATVVSLQGGKVLRPSSEPAEDLELAVDEEVRDLSTTQG